MIDFNKCEGCYKFEKQQEIILAQSDSVFDAAVDMQDFVLDCQENCYMINMLLVDLLDT